MLYDASRARHQDAAGNPLRRIERIVTAVGFLGGEAIIRGNGRSAGAHDRSQY
jgi:uncharacterized membrane protein YhiD involved in acid resistance